MNIVDKYIENIIMLIVAHYRKNDSVFRDISEKIFCDMVNDGHEDSARHIPCRSNRVVSWSSFDIEREEGLLEWRDIKTLKDCLRVCYLSNEIGREEFNRLYLLLDKVKEEEWNGK